MAAFLILAGIALFILMLANNPKKTIIALICAAFICVCLAWLLGGVIGMLIGIVSFFIIYIFA